MHNPYRNHLAALVTLSLFYYGCSSTQKISSPEISVDEVTRIERTLSADDMQGRPTFGAGNYKAASFIAEEFKRNGIEAFGNNGYMQEFTLLSPSVKSGSITIGNTSVAMTDAMIISAAENIELNQSSPYTLMRIGAKDDFRSKQRGARVVKGNVVVLVDTAHKTMFRRLQQNTAPVDAKSNTRIYVLTDNVNAESYTMNVQMNLNPVVLRNVVGIIRGKTRPDEYVIFSGHYDHLGVTKPDAKGDSIYNGANDDAAGTTGVIALSRYFKQLNNNERSVIFAAFTAEEIGGYGSGYFSEQLNPDKVVAMFNIEMIGTDSKWGRNSAYITGYDKSDMSKIMQKNLEGTGFTFHPDPYPDQQLFYRSDNATLAALGVPAHTISTAKMDLEPHYHKLSDEIGTLDMNNMTQIIKSIALASRSIVAGKDTPSRVEKMQ